MQPRSFTLPKRFWAKVTLCASILAAPAQGLPLCQGETVVTTIQIVREVETVDLRTAYDVRSYDVALDLDDTTASWSGMVQIGLEVGEANVSELEVDAGTGLTIQNCLWSPMPESDQLAVGPTAHGFRHKEGRLSVHFPTPLDARSSGVLRVAFSGKLSHGKGVRPAVRWVPSEDASGRMDCALQYAGAHNVFPCKSSFYQPEDVPDRSSLALTIPAEWVAIGPGNLESVESLESGRKVHRFRLNHPTPTWALGFAAGPYVMRSFPWKGKGDAMNIELYRLRGHEAAFDEMASISPRLLDHHERIFGPYPFADSRLAIVETLSSSSANASWIGVGSHMLNLAEESGSVAISANKGSHILAHELGHAWWGHGLFVNSWRDNWLHESFASYGALLFLGNQEGPEAMDQAFQQIAGDVSFKHRLALCDRASACSATSISTALWFKGPWVLRTLRSQIHNDEQWFGALADFQQRYRFQTVTTEDLARVLGEHTGQSWDRFFEEWFESSGLPCIVGTVRIASDRLLVDLENRKDRILTRIPGKEGRNFHLGLSLQWREGSEIRERRLQLEPGDNSWSIECNAEPTGVRLVGLESILGPHEVKILPLPHSGLGRR